MKTTIWLVATVVSALPLILLGTRNPRAVLIGAPILGLLIGGPLLALGVGGAGFGSPGQAREAAEWSLKLMIGLAAFAIVNFVLLKGSIPQRINWTFASVLVWGLVAGIFRIAWGQVDQIDREAADEEYLAPIRAAEARAVELRKELDAAPERRKAALDSALEAIRPVFAKSYEKLERWVVFGDPVSAPDSVVVWQVVTMRENSSWAQYGYHAQEQWYKLNTTLRLAGYPAKVALGAVPSEVVNNAGGDRAYFGEKGEKAVPQFPPTYVNATGGTIPPTLELPKRR